MVGNENSNFSVLVVSCDKNISILDVFFRMYSLHFPIKKEIYLSLEEKDYSYDNLQINVINGGKQNWSKRVKEALEKIPSKAILLLLDDYLIESIVDIKELDKLANLINADDGIANFILTPIRMKNVSDELYYDKYYLRAHYGRYKVALQASMWNKEEFISILKDSENAWQVEAFGNMRSYLSNRRYYAIAENEYKPIDYNDGLFCVRGKQNTAELKRLNNKFSMDFRIKDIPDDGGVIKRDPCPMPKRIIRRIKIIIINTWYRFLSVIKK